MHRHTHIHTTLVDTHSKAPPKSEKRKEFIPINQVNHIYLPTPCHPVPLTHDTIRYELNPVNPIGLKKAKEQK